MNKNEKFNNIIIKRFWKLNHLLYFSLYNYISF